MEVVYSYVKKYATAGYNLCAGETLKAQVNDLMSQCRQHNAKLQGRPLTKKLKKQKLANEIAVLLRVKHISEQMGEQWAAQRIQIGEQVEKFGENLVKVATASTIEVDELRMTVSNMTERNCELQEQIQQCHADLDMKSRLVDSLQLKLSRMEDLAIALESKLQDAKSQLLGKEQCIAALNEQKIKCQMTNICTITDTSTPNETASATATGYLNQNTSALTIKDRLVLCQTLGEFNTMESPVSLSTKFEDTVKQYTLSDHDACSLLKAWLPGPITARLSACVKDNIANAEERMKELQRVLNSRDDRGMNDLHRMRFKRGDDPLLFCNKYVTLYRKVYNCPDMADDDPSLLYSMANNCQVNYSSRIALKNARSFQTFINILRDCCEDWPSDRYGSDADVSVVSRGTRKKKFIRCYKCHRTGHIRTYCTTPDISCLVQDGGIAERNSHPQDHKSRPHGAAKSHGDSEIKQDGIKGNSPHHIFSQQAEGTSLPMYSSYANLPFWLVCAWSQIALPFFINNMATFASTASLI